MNVLELQRLDEPVRAVALAGVFPGRDVAEVLVVTEGLAVLGLEFLAEVAAARLAAFQGVEAEELAELEEVGDAAGLLERLVDLVAVAQDADVLPEFRAELGDLLERGLESLLVAGHAAVGPEDLAQLAVEVIDRPLALDVQELLEPIVHPRLGAPERGVIGADLLELVRREVIAQ